MGSTRYRRRRTPPELARWAALTAEDNSMELAVLRGRLAQALTEEITPRQREVLAMYYREELNLEQIGRALGIHQSTVSRTLRRGENHLRRCLRFGSPVLLNAEPEGGRSRRREKADP